MVVDVIKLQQPCSVFTMLGEVWRENCLLVRPNTAVVEELRLPGEIKGATKGTNLLHVWKKFRTLKGTSCNWHVCVL